MNKRKFKLLSIICSLVMVFMLLPTGTAFADTGATITTTLTDGLLQKGAKKTFDVFAHNANGDKISSSVTLNGVNVPYTWDDNNKTSYTLLFTQQGNNEIVVSAGGKSITYNITYKKAQPGEVIGYATWSVEALTTGYGFIIEPIEVPIIEDENAAQMLDRILTDNGFSYNMTGGLTSGFYLSSIGRGGELNYGSEDAFGAGDNFCPPEYIEDFVPQILADKLPDACGDLCEGWCDGEGTLGEFDYSYMSGWMYAVNSVFPNVGFADCYPSDGDVIRVQFTLAGYGADIGGGWQDSDFYKVADKDVLYTELGKINSSPDRKKLLADNDIKSAYDKAIAVATTLDASQEEVNSAVSCLVSAQEPKYVRATKLIASIGEVSLDNESTIESARAMYNALSEDEKLLVKNYNVLLSAEKSLAQLKNQTTDKDVQTDEGIPEASNPKTGADAKAPFALVIVMGVAVVTALKKRKAE